MDFSPFFHAILIYCFFSLLKDKSFFLTFFDINSREWENLVGELYWFIRRCSTEGNGQIKLLIFLHLAHTILSANPMCLNNDSINSNLLENNSENGAIFPEWQNFDINQPKMKSI